VIGAEILEASARMLASAEASAWDDLASHAAERDRLLQQIPVAQVSLDILKALLAHNEQVKALVGGARDELGHAMGEQRRTHRALNAYLHTATG
jgi:hypothetical protein